MTITMKDLKERLKLVDEISILEVLEISTEDILNRFEDKIEEKYDYLAEEFEDDDEETELHSSEIY